MSFVKIQAIAAVSAAKASAGTAGMVNVPTVSEFIMNPAESAL